MINDLITLVELTRQLVARKSDLDKAFFDNFIEPMWELFSKIHQDYKDSFTRYRELVTNEEGDPKELVYSLVETIKIDSLYTSDLRSNLNGLIRNIPSSTLKVSEGYLSSFVQAINRYFKRDYSNYPGYNYLLNLRAYLESSIKFQMDRPKYDQDIKEDIVPLIDASLRYVQANYELVAEAYYKLRKQLLS